MGLTRFLTDVRSRLAGGVKHARAGRLYSRCRRTAAAATRDAYADRLAEYGLLTPARS